MLRGRRAFRPSSGFSARRRGRPVPPARLPWGCAGGAGGPGEEGGDAQGTGGGGGGRSYRSRGCRWPEASAVSGPPQPGSGAAFPKTKVKAPARPGEESPAAGCGAGLGARAARGPGPSARDVGGRQDALGRRAPSRGSAPAPRCRGRGSRRAPSAQPAACKGERAGGSLLSPPGSRRGAASPGRARSELRRSVAGRACSAHPPQAVPRATETEETSWRSSEPPPPRPRRCPQSTPPLGHPPQFGDPVPTDRGLFPNHTLDPPQSVRFVSPARLGAPSA